MVNHSLITSLGMKLSHLNISDDTISMKSSHLQGTQFQLQAVSSVEHLRVCLFLFHFFNRLCAVMEKVLLIIEVACVLHKFIYSMKFFNSQDFFYYQRNFSLRKVFMGQYRISQA